MIPETCEEDLLSFVTMSGLGRAAVRHQGSKSSFIRYLIDREERWDRQGARHVKLASDHIILYVSSWPQFVTFKHGLFILIWHICQQISSLADWSIFAKSNTDVKTE